MAHSFFVFLPPLWHTRLQQKGVDLPSRTSATMGYRHGPRTTNKGPTRNHASNRTPCRGRAFGLALASHFDSESLRAGSRSVLFLFHRRRSFRPRCEFHHLRRRVRDPAPSLCERVILFPHPVGSTSKHFFWRPTTPNLKLHRGSHSIPLRFLRMYFLRMIAALCPIGARLGRSPSCPVTSKSPR